MKIGVITLFPEMFDSLHYGVVGRAIEKALITLEFYNPRDYTTDPNRRIDDRPYGGGPGMVMQYQPLFDAIAAAKKQLGNDARVIYLSPQGQPLTQPSVTTFSTASNLILLAGRYEGIDERLFSTCIDEEWSIGDFVVSGGELPAMLLIDAIARLQPGALGHELSAAQDSFSEGLLDCPHYTRPEAIGDLKVPPVLLSGDHQAIARWRLKESLGNTWQKRPDLVKRRVLTDDEQQLLAEYLAARGNKHEQDH